MMNRAKISAVMASVVLAAGVMGLCGCGGDKVQEIMQEMPSGESKEQTPSEESSLGEESVSASTEPEFESDASNSYVELEKWAESYIETSLLGEMGLSQELVKDAKIEYVVDVQEEGALIRYYIEASDHSIYVVDEKVSLNGQNGDYVVTRESLQPYTSITDAEMYGDLYGASGINVVSTGYSTRYFTGLVRDMLADDTLAERYNDPVDAAVNLLHLGPGKGEVAGDMVKPQITPDSWMEDLDEDIPLEGTTVTITYTFDKDGSVVEIPMELIEASFGIWAPAEGNWCRQIHRSYVFYEHFEDGESKYIDIIQNSIFGLYELKDGCIRCIFPYYTAPDIDIIQNDRDVIYFMADSLYQEGNLDYQIDCIAMLDLTSGQVDMESMMLPEGVRFGEAFFMYPQDGFLHIADSFYLPYVNVGTADFSGGVSWNGKPVAGLSEAEQNAYGSENRAKLLSEPGKVLQLSLRTMTETYSYIDMDGDGVTEKIILTGQAFDMPYDEMKLQIGDTILEESRWNLQNDIYAVSLDGKEILFFLMENGASGDYSSCFYGYRDGKLVKVGEMPGLANECVIEDGCISSKMRVDLLQSDFVEGKWHVGADGLLQMVPQDSYDFTGQNDVTLKVALPVHSEPNQESAKHDIQPQTVKFLKTDTSFSWVYVQAENSDAGWVLIEGYGMVKELDMSAFDVFDKLMQFG